MATGTSSTLVTTGRLSRQARPMVPNTHRAQQLLAVAPSHLDGLQGKVKSPRVNLEKCLIRVVLKQPANGLG